MHSASTSALERKSSPPGSHAWQSTSVWNHNLALAVSASRKTLSLETSAYSRDSAIANALLKWVPTLMG